MLVELKNIAFGLKEKLKAMTVLTFFSKSENGLSTQAFLGFYTELIP
jgi:hypothetical protein